LKTLERMALPGLDAAIQAIHRAESFRQITTRSGGHAGLIQFQSALALIQAMTSSGGISSATAHDLVLQLAMIEPSVDHGYQGRIAEWLFAIVNSRLREELDTSNTDQIEDLILKGLAGQAKTRPRPLFEWDGFKYVFDPSAGALDRIRKIRQQQRIPLFDNLAQFVSATKGILHATSPSEFRSFADHWKEAGHQLVRLVPRSTLTAGQRPYDIALTFRDAERELARSLAERNPAERLSRYEREFLELTDWFTAHMLLATAYSAALRNADGDPLLSAGDISLRHDLGLGRENRQVRDQIAWDRPVALVSAVIDRTCPDGGPGACVSTVLARRGVPWHVEGSILGLDAALVPVTAVSEGIPTRNRFGETDRGVLVQSVALTSLTGTGNDSRLTDAVGLVRTGRELLAQRPGDLSRRAGWRYAAIPWVLAHEPAAMPNLLRPTELLVLAAETDPDGFDYWGGAPSALSGCECLTLLISPPLDELAQHVDLGYLGIVASDLRLRLAELLVSRRLPAAMTGLVYEKAILDFETKSVAGDIADWLALSAAFATLTEQQFDTYVETLRKHFQFPTGN
jgi:hypothetical protein